MADEDTADAAPPKSEAPIRTIDHQAPADLKQRSESKV
jgi:hypothetical protein